ncbi:DNA-deoxyinosine glycosylase [Rhodococcus sp. NPDC058505]|uniref:DNA-deoxyinosine glycosylase n=1 Tax=Rhodococcus sp. NPDC058505 TaxID=3346531 RepID=UPI00364A1F30
MTLVHGFPAVVDDSSHTLILGSMPGAPSLVAGRYYANPRNSFWPIMGELFGAGPDQPYPHRLRTLQDNGVALWDVLKACRRTGSADADIEVRSEVPNDFAALYSRHTAIERVFFNGARAEMAYRRSVVAAGAHPAGVTLARLPSTSPANAATPARAKVDAWRALLER